MAHLDLHLLVGTNKINQVIKFLIFHIVSMKIIFDPKLINLQMRGIFISDLTILKMSSFV